MAFPAAHHWDCLLQQLMMGSSRWVCLVFDCRMKQYQDLEVAVVFSIVENMQWRIYSAGSTCSWDSTFRKISQIVLTRFNKIAT